jgi:hypothetical protein
MVLICPRNFYIYDLIEVIGMGGVLTMGSSRREVEVFAVVAFGFFGKRMPLRRSNSADPMFCDNSLDFIEFEYY